MKSVHSHIKTYSCYKKMALHTKYKIKKNNCYMPKCYHYFVDLFLVPTYYQMKIQNNLLELSIEVFIRNKEVIKFGQ